VGRASVEPVLLRRILRRRSIDIVRKYIEDQRA
jgi:hypothetical protein